MIMPSSRLEPANKKMTLSVSLYLLVPFSGFYTVKLGYSPIYLTFIMGVLAMLVRLIDAGWCWKTPRLLLINFAFILYALLFYFIGWKFDSYLPSAWVNLVFSLIYFAVVMVVLEGVGRSHVIRAYEMSVIFSIILLTIELAYRLMNPAEPEAWTDFQDDISWYIYKTSSFMYPDSNSIGLYASCMLAFIIGLPTSLERRFKIYIYPLIVLLIGSLSRAAIISAGIVLIYSYINVTKVKSFIIFMATIVALAFLFELIREDDSFLSKFWIAGLFIDHITTANLYDLIIGMGPGNSEVTIGVGAHLLPFMVLIEIGIAGAFLLLIFLRSIWRLAGKNGTPLFLVILLNGLSFSTFAIPWFYSMAAGMIYLVRKSTDASLSIDPRI